MAVNQEVDTLENMKNINTVPLAYYESHHEDEINLLDLWCVLAKRKRLFNMVLLLCVLLGLTYAIIKPQLFNYSAAIEIGSRVHGQELIHIEPPANVLGKINSGYIPLASAQYIQKNSTAISAPEIKTDLVKDSAIIHLSIKGQNDDQVAYYELLSEIMGNLKNDHLRLFSIERKDLQLAIKRINNLISQLKDENNLLVAQNKRLDGKASLLETRIINTRKLIANSEKNKAQAISNARSEGKALALMMVENDLRQANDLLSDLEMDLHINLDNQRDSLMNQIAKNIRAQKEQQDQLTKVQIQLDNLQETKVLIEPMKSLKPVGQSKKLIVLVSVVAGIFLALFVVFFAEFLEKARSYAAEKNQSV
ncbi:MAG: Wzz/FepE/Etk N-terminal domain-containing protein [Gammaproteobacteria bacterium]|nr:Wzz/FepE/Etk N-terminal domain-containing protein [Gammaproteobacteria bacterium]